MKEEGMLFSVMNILFTHENILCQVSLLSLLFPVHFSISVVEMGQVKYKDYVFNYDFINGTFGVYFMEREDIRIRT